MNGAREFTARLRRVDGSGISCGAVRERATSCGSRAARVTWDSGVGINVRDDQGVPAVNDQDEGLKPGKVNGVTR
jgi:hypothetical protein